MKQTLPPFLRLVAVQKILSSSFYQTESPAQTLGCTKPTRQQIIITFSINDYYKNIPKVAGCKI